MFDPPSSSPPSSPSPYVDSSPPSSPTSIDPIDVDFLPLPHPFSGAAKATRTPPKYEKKTHTPPDTPRPNTYAIKKPRFLDFEADDNDSEFLDLDGPDIPAETLAFEDPETSTWTTAIDKVFDMGHGIVNLEYMNLSYIPHRIKDLANFVALPDTIGQWSAPAHSSATSGGRLFTRVSTAPASSVNKFLHGRSSTERTSSLATTSVGLPKQEIQLFLAGNQISRLPRELCDLQKMTVLSIRKNKLTSVPSEIALLVNLRELNISDNCIKYLPSEILSMTLRQFNVHPNPFLIQEQFSPVQSSRSYVRVTSTSPVTLHGMVSETRYVSDPVLSLSELCLRCLFSPASNEVPPPPPPLRLQPPNINNCELGGYPVPFQESMLPQHIEDTFAACMPGSVAVPLTSVFQPQTDRVVRLRSSVPGDDTTLTGLGICAAPHARVFVQHVEERFTWEPAIAGVSMGGAVPVRWRGCQRGCLDFLDVEPEDAQAAEGDVEIEEGDKEEGEIVLIVAFGSERLGADEFDE